MPIRHLDIAVIGDEELVSAFRLAGIGKYYTVKDNHDVHGSVRKTLTQLLADPNVGIVIILEDYAQYAQELITEARKKKGTSPVIVEVPSKFGTKYPDVREYYRALIRQSIGFEVEI
ncbi:MAG: V-type ATP synthase subunit F [Candidatus Bathyarchaeia archaeon]